MENLTLESILFIFGRVILIEIIDGKQYFSSDVRRCLLGKQHEELISMLKSCRNLANIVDCNGKTLLPFSTSYDNAYITEYLINENLDINAVDNYGDTPLMSAIQGEVTADIWSMLLEAGSDLWNIKNNRGQCVMTVVIEKYRSRDYIRKLIAKEIEKRNPDTSDIVDALLDAGYELYQVNIFRKVEITKLMSERGCPVNLQDSSCNNTTALHVAANENDLDNVKLLLQHGADKNILDSNGLPPVAYNFLNDNHDMKLIKLILPDNKDWAEEGWGMFVLCKFCRKEVLKFLIKHYGIDFNKRDESGRSPLHYFVENKDPDIWEILVNVDVDAVMNYYDLDCGEAALHKAVSRSNAAAVRFLLDAGANVNLLDNKGRPPLFYVKIRQIDRYRDSFRECIELLMQAGADAQLVDRDGETIVSRLASDSRTYVKDLIEPILTHLAIAEDIGVKLNPVISSYIDSFAKYSFAECRRKVDEMKDKTISGTITFIKFLTADDKKIWKYVRNDGVFEELSRIQDVAISREVERERNLNGRGAAGEIPASPRSNRPQGLFREFFYDVNPINADEWRSAKVGVKLLLLLRAPFMLVLQFLVPVVNETAEKRGWSKLLNCVQFCVTPVVGLCVLELWDVKIGPVPLLAVCFGCTLLLALVIFLLTSTDRIPKFHNALAFVGFLTAMLVVYAVAQEVMAVLETVGFASGISDAMLGITLLAWGNSVGDLISNVTIARKGYARMGFSACFGGPMFNTLLGLGLTFGISAARADGFKIAIRTSDMAPGCLAFLLCSLVSSLIYLTITGFTARRTYGYLLYSVYGVFMLINVLSEVHVIHPLGTDHRPDDVI